MAARARRAERRRPASSRPASPRATLIKIFDGPFLIGPVTALNQRIGRSLAVAASLSITTGTRRKEGPLLHVSALRVRLSSESRDVSPVGVRIFIHLIAE